MTRLQKRLKKICLLMVKYAISNKNIQSGAIFQPEQCSERTPFKVILMEYHKTKTQQIFVSRKSFFSNK